MNVIHRFRYAIMLAVLVLVLAACGDGADDAAEEPADDPPADAEDDMDDEDAAMDDEAMDDEDAAMDDEAAMEDDEDAAMEDDDDAMEDDEDAAMEDDEDEAMDDGATQVAVDCQVELPEDGPGSAEGMAEDPAATAAANNPELSTLVEAVDAAGLVDTLNDTEAEYTIFAPANAAFEEIPEEDLNALLEDPEALTDVLTYHVAGEEMTIQDLVDDGSVTSLQGEDVTVDAPDEATVTVGAQDANVLCADVETANASVHIIDTVLMPADAM